MMEENKSNICSTNQSLTQMATTTFAKEIEKMVLELVSQDDRPH